MIEIERKFLVTSEDFKKQAFAKHEIAQGYLNSNPDRTVRIRIKGESGFLTIKGKNNASGVTRFEWETEIAIMEAKPLLALCEKGIILKTRYEIRVGKHVFEVDVFHSDNDGLIIAEIELSSEEELFEKPNWLGKEVTNDNRFYNSYISQKPFKEW